jgi:maleate cis-trans isomerase
MINLVPKYQLGYILPVMVADPIFHQFYRVAPPEVMLLGHPINLGSFSSEGVEKAMPQFWPAFDFLVKRGADCIVQGGIPFSATIGRPRTLQLLEEGRKRTSVRFDADFEEVIDAFKALGVQRIALAAKWSDGMMQGVSDYLAHAGLQPLKWVNESHTYQEVQAISPQDGVDLALELGRKAFKANPDAEALLLAGGAWLSLQAVPVLEAEFGKPVVTNPSATYWRALQQFGLKSPQSGWGRLIDGLPGPGNASRA